MTRHTYPCPVRWSDMDAYGVVNNVSLVRYLEEARLDLIHQMAPSLRDAFFRGGSVVVGHQIRYLRQLIHQHETVDVEIWVSHLQWATVALDYRVKDTTTVYATASTTMAPFDYTAGRPRRITDAEYAFLAHYWDTAPEPLTTVV